MTEFFYYDTVTFRQVGPGAHFERWRAAPREWWLAIGVLFPSQEEMNNMRRISEAEARERTIGADLALDAAFRAPARFVLLPSAVGT